MVAALEDEVDVDVNEEVEEGERILLGVHQKLNKRKRYGAGVGGGQHLLLLHCHDS